MQDTPLCFLSTLLWASSERKHVLSRPLPVEFRFGPPTEFKVSPFVSLLMSHWEPFE